MNLSDINNKKSRRNPNTSRPLKKLLNSPPLSSPDTYSIHHHRRLFLQTLSEQYTFPPFKYDLWSGTALHLLLLTHKITPTMYQAALTYTSFGRKNLYGSPILSHIPLDENLSTFERKKTLSKSLLLEKPEDRESEKIWRDLNKLLIETDSKVLLDSLTENENLNATKAFLTDEVLLKRLRNGLNSLKKYLGTSVS